MRKTSLIHIIRKYGLGSSRLSLKCRIKYEDALKKMKSYESAELRIVDVIDNHFEPSRSISHHCQIESCGQVIRYEYVLENKITGQRIVAGSTCVWPLLGFSEIQKKEFLKMEEVIRERHLVVEWRQSHQDVLERLQVMRANQFWQFRPFWEEVEYTRLTNEDTDYILSIDLERLVKEKREKERKQEERRAAEEKARLEAEEMEKKILKGLDKLVVTYPQNGFYASLKKYVDSGRKLSENQIRHIKLGCNRLWYKEHIKGTSRDTMDKCVEIMDTVKAVLGVRDYDTLSNEDVRRIETDIQSFDEKIKMAWALLKVKKDIVLV